jgi:hypothetical protein
MRLVYQTGYEPLEHWERNSLRFIIQLTPRHGKKSSYDRFPAARRPERPEPAGGEGGAGGGGEGGSKSASTTCHARAVSRDIRRSAGLPGRSWGRGWWWGRPWASQSARMRRWKPAIHLRHAGPCHCATPARVTASARSGRAPCMPRAPRLSASTRRGRVPAPLTPAGPCLPSSPSLRLHYKSAQPAVPLHSARAGHRKQLLGCRMG